MTRSAHYRAASLAANLLRAARMFFAAIIVAVMSAVASSAGTSGPTVLSPELESRVEAVWKDLRYACSMELDGGVVARLAALRRDPELRRAPVWHWADLAVWEMAYYWRRGALDEAVRVYEEWAVGATMPEVPDKDFARLVQQRSFAARGVKPPALGWIVHEIESVAVKDRGDAIAIAWHNVNCRLSPEDPRRLVTLYVPRSGSDKLRRLGAPVRVDLYGIPSFDTVMLPDASGMPRSHLVVWSNRGLVGWHHLRLFAIDPKGLHEIQLGDDLRILELEDLDQDGQLEAVAAYPRFDCLRPLMDHAGTYVGGTWSCADRPARVRAVFAWRGGRFIEACREFPRYYADLAAQSEQNARGFQRDPNNHYDYELRRYAHAAFAVFGALVQVGNIDVGIERFGQLMESAPFDAPYRDVAQKAVLSLKTQVERQRADLDRPCPMAGLVFESD